MKPRKNAGISGAGGKNVAKPYAPEIFPMTHSQSIKFGKMNMSPKTSTTLFTLPKGTTKLPQSEKDAIQRRRTLDRQRTLARAKFIIKRDN
jgi:hypothetical protein